MARNRTAIHRAKDFAGLLVLVTEAAATLKENHLLLSRSTDNESLMAAQRTREVHANIEFLRQDLAKGLTKLDRAPFDREGHERNFKGSGIRLHSDPERRFSKGRREKEADEIVLTRVIPPEHDDFARGDSGELMTEKHHQRDCDDFYETEKEDAT